MREAGVSYWHIAYEDGPKNPEEEPWRDSDGPRTHDVAHGCECWCEPKCLRVGPKSVLVIHDPQDGLVAVRDNGEKK